MPQRLQRSRKKGARLPEGTVVVMRPGQYGNPYKIGDPNPLDPNHKITRDDAIELFWDYLANMDRSVLHTLLKGLRGKDLSCSCELSAHCHADIWLLLANMEPEKADSLLRWVSANCVNE